MILVLGRALALACRGHHELVLENLALRQQLNALRRTVGRSHLRRRDRLFWVVLAQTWRNWRAALVLVKPDTVGAMASRMASPAMDAALGGVVRVAEGPTSPFAPWCARWPLRIRAGERLGTMASCWNLASRSRRERARD